MTAEKSGEYVTSADADKAGEAWLALTDEERSELLLLRSKRQQQNTLPTQQVGSATSADWPVL